MTTSATRAPRGTLWIIGVAPFAASIVGSLFNIWYTLSHVQPLLTPQQNNLFQEAIGRYNSVVYPIALAIWIFYIITLRAGLTGTGDDKALRRSRTRAINLPWVFAILMLCGWGGCIPYFLHAIGQSTEPIHADVTLHLTTSIGVAAMTGITHAVFILELLAQRLLFPILFRDVSPSSTSGAFALSLGRRGLLCAISAGACPILSLLLIAWADRNGGHAADTFAAAVAVVGIVFGLLSAWMLAHLVLGPVHALRRAAAAVTDGRLDTHIDLLRADEFGPLIDQFNTMVGELRAKQRLRETLGLHVGERAAERILASDTKLGGQQIEITAMFCDIRGFTARCERESPGEVVAALNRFLTEAVTIIEQRHGGLVNKFLGDGFMALFGATGDDQQHASRALHAAMDLLEQVRQLNQSTTHEPIAIGIGLHTGPAIVGTMGSNRRMEFTAIGATINLAARLEGLCKTLNQSLVFSQATYRATNHTNAHSLGPQAIRGVEDPVEVFTMTG